MNEYPIDLTADEVRAILAGRKTQARQLVVNPPDVEHPGTAMMLAGRVSPFGVNGDRLWVREPWRALNRFNAAPVAEGSWVAYEAEKPKGDARPAPVGRMGHLRTSAEMPRWAARLILGVTAVCLERVQEIDEASALADGGWLYRNCPFHKAPELSFRHQWEARHGAEAWTSNPLVWVAVFHVLQGGTP